MSVRYTDLQGRFTATFATTVYKNMTTTVLGCRYASENLITGMTSIMKVLYRVHMFTDCAHIVYLCMLSLHCGREFISRKSYQRIHIGDFIGMFIDIFRHWNRETDWVSLAGDLSEKDDQ